MNDPRLLYFIAVLAIFVVGIVILLIWEVVRSQLRFQAICDNSGNMIVIGKALTNRDGVIADITIVGCNDVYAPD